MLHYGLPYNVIKFVSLTQASSCEPFCPLSCYQEFSKNVGSIIFITKQKACNVHHLTLVKTEDPVTQTSVILVRTKIKQVKLIKK